MSGAKSRTCAFSACLIAAMACCLDPVYSQEAAATPAAPAAAAAPEPPAPAPPAAPAAPSVSLHELIDRLVAAGWQSRGITGAGLCHDAEFLRRVYLDLTGTIPSAAEATAFLGDPALDKREKLVDKLLASPEFARRWAIVFDVMLMERRPANRVPQTEWHEYLRASFAANKPLDQLTREILGSDGTDPALRPAARFYLDREGEVNLLTRDVGRLFLGADLQCAQCHDHPLISGYHQADYYGLSAFLNRSFIFTPKDQPPVIAEKAEGEVSFKSVFIKDQTDQGALPHLPGEPAAAEPKFDAGQEYAVAPADNVRPVPKYSRKAQLAALLPRAESTAFRRNLANRLWQAMMGRGLVHPVDMHHPDNPASHPELLALLGDRLAEMKFDVRAMLREIAVSQTYQRTSEWPLPGDRPAPQLYATACLKPLSPEQLGLSLLQATGSTDVTRTALGAGLTEAALWEKLAPNLQWFVGRFGSIAGQPEDRFSVSLDQILWLSNDGAIFGWLAPQPGSLVDRLSKISDSQAVATDLFVSVLTRPPYPEETAEVVAHLQGRDADRPTALTELAWALLTSNEFRFNH